MINSNKIYVGDVGLAVICNIGVQTTYAENIELKVRKPDGTEVIWGPGEPHEVDGVPNYVRYITKEGDLDQRGRYKIQPKLKLSGWEGYGETDDIRVDGRYR
jgi:hypothetical protein